MTTSIQNQIIIPLKNGSQTKSVLKIELRVIQDQLCNNIKLLVINNIIEQRGLVKELPTNIINLMKQSYHESKKAE